jgi:eukaryotic-like serine/threonine-protein kinase
MPTVLGSTIAHYKVTAKLGQGGMGEVYRATDTKLDREVAIKVLPESFTQDRERLARFDREAKTLASVNHPNIASIYGLENSGGKMALVLELIEGETLAERLRAGAMPVEETLEVCRQIAEALEAAHEKGIIHRDLKPGNIKITPEGRVKVLDFGLAKATIADSSVSPSDNSQSPTLTADFTRPGVILGTAAYMSPEQARGKPVDKRTDNWSFGCVLYECLTGKRIFHGEDVTETLATVIKGEPDWSALPSETPATIQLLLRKCLAKDRKRRLHDIPMHGWIWSRPSPIRAVRVFDSPTACARPLRPPLENPACSWPA